MNNLSPIPQTPQGSEIPSQQSRKSFASRVQTLPPPQEHAPVIIPEDVAKSASENQDKAEAILGKAEKWGFRTSLVSLALGGAVLALTLLSGGAAVVALAGAALLVAAGDTVCAYVHYQRVKAGTASLPMKGDFLGNIIYGLTHLLYKTRRDTNGNATGRREKIIPWVAFTINQGLMIASASVGAFVQAVSHFKIATEVIQGGVRPALGGLRAGLERHKSAKDQDLAEKRGMAEKETRNHLQKTNLDQAQRIEQLEKEIRLFQQNQRSEVKASAGS